MICEKAPGENAPRWRVPASRVALVGMFRLAGTVCTDVLEIGGGLMKYKESHRHVPTGYFYKMGLSWLWRKVCIAEKLMLTITYINIIN